MRKNTKNSCLKKIREIYSKQFETIDIMTKNANDLGQANVDMPNIGTLVNNKIIELSHIFEEHGISIFSSESKDYDFVTSSFLGNAIIQDLTDKINQSVEKMNEYGKKMEEVSVQRNKRIQALQNISPMRKFFSKIRSLFVPAKPIDLSLTDEEQSILDSSLQEYKDIGDKIWNYNLDDNLVPALVKAIAGPLKFENFNISSHRYRAQVVPTLIEEDVVPDLKKLGLEGLVPKLQEALTKEYKKDLPDPETYKIADEDMFLYVPDFSNKIDEKHDITKKEIPEPQIKGKKSKRIFRFMSKEEFKNYLQGEPIKGKFAKGKACFLEENIPAREKEASIRQLTDITSLNFTSTDFEGQMKELSELISPTFKTGDFEGQLKKLEYLTLADFMNKIRDGVTADVFVEFETTDAFEQESDKVIMSYKNHLIEEIQSNEYSMETLHCVSYKIDLINGFKNGVGLDTIRKNKFEGVEHTLKVLEALEKQEDKNIQELPIDKLGMGNMKKQEKQILEDSAIEATEDIRTGKINEQAENIKSKQKEKSISQNIEGVPVSQDK